MARRRSHDRPRLGAHTPVPVDVYDICFGAAAAIPDRALRAHLRLLWYSWANTPTPGVITDNEGHLTALAGVSKLFFARHKTEILHGYTKIEAGWLHPTLQRKGAKLLGQLGRMNERHKRATVGIRLRFAIFERDGFRCRYCGVTADGSELHIDHVQPLSQGGTSDPGNLVTACANCNLGKSDRLILMDRPKGVQ